MASIDMFPSIGNTDAVELTLVVCLSLQGRSGDGKQLRAMKQLGWCTRGMGREGAEREGG